jgi:hypothetical protein
MIYFNITEIPASVAASHTVYMLLLYRKSAKGRSLKVPDHIKEIVR